MIVTVCYLTWETLAPAQPALEGRLNASEAQEEELGARLMRLRVRLMTKAECQDID